MKGKESKPYLSEHDRSNFNKMLEEGTISFFKVADCQRNGCTNEVPNSIQYCSRKCYRIAEGIEDDSDGDQGEMD